MVFFWMFLFIYKFYDQVLRGVIGAQRAKCYKGRTDDQTDGHL